MSIYEKKSLLDNRYQLLASSSIYTYDDDNLTSYAEFLRKFGRYIGKDGFVDANSSIQRFKLKQKNTDKRKLISKSASLPEISKDFNVISVSKSHEARQKVHEKHLKIIEDQMIQSKQPERDFKRQEGDIKKEQQAIRQAIRELDTVISKKRLDADKNLSKNLEEKHRLEIDNAHKKKETTKQRTERVIEGLQYSKDKGRKNLIVCNDLARQYKLKMNELDIKHIELNRLQHEFEDKIRVKEEEESKIKKEIVEIALALNMEAKKVKDDLFDFQKSLQHEKQKQVKTDLEMQANLDNRIAKTSNYIKNYDLTRRRLSHDAHTEKSTWSVKQREANRRIVDTRNNLENIYHKQRKMNEDAYIAEMDRKAIEITQKLEDVNQRKNALSFRFLQEKKEQNDQHETFYNTKAQHKFLEQNIKKHEDHLKHFQKVAQKDEEQQHELYKLVKDSEFSRRKQEKEVKKLQEEFVYKQKENSAIIKELLAKIFAEEKILQNKFLKEKAKLDKFSAGREESYFKLQCQREKAKEDKFLLECHEKEYTRLQRILNRSFQSNNSA